MIDHKFLERGHTHMEVDSIHAAVEYANKSIPVFVPSDWETVCRLARKHKRAYSVLCLSHKDFIDYKSMATSFPVINQIPWKGIVWIWYMKHDSEQMPTLMYKSNYNDDFKVLSTKTTRNTQVTLKKRLYKARLPISEVKKTDLLALCRDGTIPPLYHPFYESLPTAASSEDRIPVPEDNETSDDEE